MKRFLILVLGGVLFIGLIGCGKSVSILADMDRYLITNPFVEYETLEEVERNVGFEVALPSEISGYDKPIYRLSKDLALIEVIFINLEDENKDINFRKARGEHDISGDYTRYADIKNVDGVVLRGDRGLISLALWSDGNYSYAIKSTSTLTEDKMLELVKSFK